MDRFWYLCFKTIRFANKNSWQWIKVHVLVCMCNSRNLLHNMQKLRHVGRSWYKLFVVDHHPLVIVAVTKKQKSHMFSILYAKPYKWIMNYLWDLIEDIHIHIFTSPFIFVCEGKYCIHLFFAPFILPNLNYYSFHHISNLLKHNKAFTTSMHIIWSLVSAFLC